MYKRVLLIIFVFGGGCLIGWLLARTTSTAASSLAPVDVRFDTSNFDFINPLLFSRTNKNLYVDEFQSYSAILKNEIDNFKKQGAATSISVYYRDLNSSHWTGLGEDDKYDPSSLLKVVLLMAYLKKSLGHPEVLSTKLYYEGADETGQYYKETETLPKGYYTVLELLQAMITQSDNVAKTILTANASKNFEETYKEFRLPLPKTPTTNDYMSARSYSVIFRTLYNSTYLPWDFSEQTLALLAVTRFDKGIVAGVPEKTVVSHKFGEHTYIKADGTVESRELHDCGIVYYPGKPYLLCVMTRGKDFSSLEKVISTLSKDTYSFVSSQNK